MAKHKSATEVTIAPIEERSTFQEVVHRTWKLALLAFLVVAAGVLWSVYRDQVQKEERDEGWNGLRDLIQVQAGPFGMPDVQLAGGDALETFARGAGTSGAGAWAQALAATAYFEEGDVVAAEAALQSLEERFPGHPLVTRSIGDLTEGQPPVSALRSHLSGLEALKSELPQLEGNPAIPEGSARVVLETERGEIEVALYEGRAPEHVANFLKLVDEGTYVGTKFHRIDPNFMIQGGDQNSIEGEPSTWGTGDAGYTIPQEHSDLYHFPGVLAMAKRPDQTDSSGHQFYITVAPSHHLDWVHTVFGSVTRGMDVVEGISKGEIESGTADRPAAPVTITGARRL